MTQGPAEDPKRLVAEAYRMAGLGDAECRSILVDWALSLDMAADAAAARVLARAPDPDHPMTALLREAARAAPPPRRRGGRSARLGVTGGADREGEGP